MGCGIRASINGDDDIQASCPDKLLAEGHNFLIRTTINEIQPSRVHILETRFCIEIIERLQEMDRGQLHPSITTVPDRGDERTLGQFATSIARVGNLASCRLSMS